MMLLWTVKAERSVVHADQDGRLVWRSFIGDAKLGPAMSKFGSLMIAIDPVADDSIGWPEGQETFTRLGEFLLDGIGASKTFLSGRLDLAKILA
jgi:hypothetical protein